MKTEKDKEAEVTIEYITEDDKRELVLQWLARKWNEEEKTKTMR